MTISMYLLNEIKHNVHIQCHWTYLEGEKFNDIIEIDILRNSPNNGNIGSFALLNRNNKTLLLNDSYWVNVPNTNLLELLFSEQLKI